MRLLAFFILILITQFEAKTQTYPSGRISLNSGSRVSFEFNTLEKFSNGLEKPNFTEIEIDFIDTDNNFGWELGVQASSSNINPTFINGVGLPLDIIELTTAPCPACSPIVVLSSGFEILADETWPGGGLGVEKKVNTVINISYYCNQSLGNGQIVNLGDFVNDTYVVELEFTLRRKQ